jgi:hypothetical protein
MAAKIARTKLLYRPELRAENNGLCFVGTRYTNGFLL